MLHGGVRRLVRWWSLRPGERAVVIAADDRDLGIVNELREAGTKVVETIDLRDRPPRQIAASGRGGRLRAVEVAGPRPPGDPPWLSGWGRPAYHLPGQA